MEETRREELEAAAETAGAVAARAIATGSASVPEWFRRLTWHSLLASLCPLVPVPFVDDWALGWVRRRAVGSSLAASSSPAAEWQIEILAGEERPLFRSGCQLTTLVAVPVKLLVYLAKKLFRKLVIFFLIKDCVDKFSSLFHEGYLLELARDRGLLAPSLLASREHLVALREALDRATREVDPRPVEQLVRRALRGSRRLVVESARLFARFLRRERRGETSAGGDLEPEQEGLLGGLVDRLRDELWNEQGYRAELEAAFARALAASGLAARFPHSQ